MSEFTKGPWRVAMMYTAELLQAPADMTPAQRAKWDSLMVDRNKPMRHNDGAFIVSAGAGDDSGPVADVKFQGRAKRGQGHAVEDPVGLANARLIAAAPDLLEALEEACLQIEYLHEKFQPTSTSEAVMLRARAALRKAKGE